MKKSCYTVVVLLMCVLLVACGKQEQAKEIPTEAQAEKEVISQTAESIETEASQKQSEEEGDLPLIGLEEQATAKPDKETPTDAPTEKPVAKPTEAPTNAPTTKPTEEPTFAPDESPTETPTTEPTESPTEEPTTPTTEAPIELPFVPAF